MPDLSGSVGLKSLGCAKGNFLCQGPSHGGSYMDEGTSHIRIRLPPCFVSGDYCHDPSHGGFYMAEGALYIRIGLPPRVVSGDCLVSSRYGLTACSLHCRRAYPMSCDWGCTSTCCLSFYVPISSMQPWGLYLHSHVRPLPW